LAIADNTPAHLSWRALLGHPRSQG